MAAAAQNAIFVFVNRAKSNRQKQWAKSNGQKHFGL
jgi:hypothetical protein